MAAPEGACSRIAGLTWNRNAFPAPAAGSAMTRVVSQSAGPGSALTGTEDAFRLYETIRPRLPAAGPPGAALALPSLEEVADHVDGFLLDAYGVLNVGNRPIPGVPERLRSLRGRGKRLIVLTNAASFTRPQLIAKYASLGFDFAPEDVIASRDIAAARMAQIAPGAHWAAISAEGDRFEDIPAHVTDALNDPSALDHADALLFLSTARWNDHLQDRLIRALERRPRPLVIANPDVMAPHEHGLTIEPGLYGHLLLDRLPDLPVTWIGKPFADIFQAGIRQAGIEAGRVAMVGDTLHTDVLGGSAAGCRTVLATLHGVFRGMDVAPFIGASGLAPDFMIPSP